MTERVSLRLIEPVQAHKALAAAWLHCKAMLTAGHVLVLEVPPASKNIHNAKNWG